MSSLYRDGICINYTNKEIKDKKLLINALKNDPYVIKSILPKNIDLHKTNKLSNIVEDSVYIEDVYSYLKDKVTPIFEKVQFISDTLGRDELLFDVYKSALLFKYDEEENYENDCLDEDMVYSYLAMLYSDSVDSYLDLIAKPFESIRDELFAVVNNDYRDKAYNYYLRDVKDYMIDMDRDYFKVISYIFDNIKYTYKENNFDEKNITPINRDTLNYLVKRVLVRIDPTFLWLNLYEKGIKDGSIIYVDSMNELEEYGVDDSSLDDGVMYVLRDGNLNDVVVTIHEFVHYVSKKCDSFNDALDEYPSLLFEDFTYDFLVNHGYSKDEIDYFKNNRYNFLASMYNSYVPLYKLMALQEKLPDCEIGDFHTIFSGEVERTDKIINSELKFLISKPYALIDGSRYLVADLFRREYLKVNGNHLEDMVNTTETIGNNSVSNLVLTLKNDRNSK